MVGTKSESWWVSWWNDASREGNGLGAGAGAGEAESRAWENCPVQQPRSLGPRGEGPALLSGPGDRTVEASGGDSWPYHWQSRASPGKLALQWQACSPTWNLASSVACCDSSCNHAQGPGRKRGEREKPPHQFPGNTFENNISLNKECA